MKLNCYNASPFDAIAKSAQTLDLSGFVSKGVSPCLVQFIILHSQL